MTRARAEVRTSDLGSAGVWIPPEAVALLSWHIDGKMRADLAAGRHVAPAVVEIAAAAREAATLNRDRIVPPVERSRRKAKRK